MSEKSFDPRFLSALDLAFVGDSVYSLLTRTMIARQGSRPVGEMHRLAVEMVNASAQAAAYDSIAPMLTEEEQGVWRRARNGGAHPPKNANHADYAKATGLEALFGYLYLEERTDRIRELFDAILAERKEAEGGSA